MSSIRSLRRASLVPMLPLLLLLPAMFGLLAPSSSLAQAANARTMRALSGGEVERYLDVFDKLVDFGPEAQPMVESAGQGGLGGQAAALQYTTRMQSVIESGGFTLESFSEVHWNAMMAYAAAELEKNRPEMEQARRDTEAQLQAMKGQLTPEQFQQMTQAMGALGNIGPLGNVPPENIALIEQYRSRLEAIIEKGDGAR